ncbi:MAG: translation initiation factor IF-2 N-terminal domain-containing protein, partial [Thermodesulfobacteriota bacterium]|nr:translation initiation factor IF-2 N-terminal domain-containing protein [Thermodesulfobacteriota bacterium]
MAKIRVYELARDLNMNNKVLVDKLQAMDLPVKSHMSTLGTELIDKIKAEVLGTKPREYEYEETRVQATIIRRRRKVIRRKKAATDVPPEPPEPESVESLESTTAEPLVSDQTPVEDTDSGVEKSVIADLDTKTAVERAALSPSERQPEAKIPATEPESPTAEDTAQKTGPSDAAPAKTPEKPVAEVKPLKPVKKKKKKKKETPAKIIQMAPPQPAKTPVEPSPGATPAKPLPPVNDTARKKGKKGKKEDADGSDRRFFKRKISFKRRSVVEGADLYSRKKQRRKGGRWAKKKPPATGQK